MALSETCFIRSPAGHILYEAAFKETKYLRKLEIYVQSALWTGIRGLGGHFDGSPPQMRSTYACRAVK